MTNAITAMDAWSVRQVIESARLQLIQDNIEALDAVVGVGKPILSSVIVGAAATFSFPTIPDTYDWLLIKAGLQSNHTAVDTLVMRLNGDSGANYSAQHLGFTTTTVAANSFTTGTSLWSSFGGIEGDDDLDAFSPLWMLLLDYKASNRYKQWIGWTARMITTPLSRIANGLYRSTTAISSLTLAPTTGSGFVADSWCAIYGGYNS